MLIVQRFAILSLCLIAACVASARIPVAPTAEPSAAAVVPVAPAAPTATLRRLVGFAESNSPSINILVSHHVRIERVANGFLMLVSVDFHTRIGDLDVPAETYVDRTGRQRNVGKVLLVQFDLDGVVQWAQRIAAPRDVKSISANGLFIGPDGIWVPVNDNDGDPPHAVELVRISFDTHVETARVHFESTEEVYVDTMQWDAAQKPFVGMFATGPVRIPHVTRPVNAGTNGGILVAFDREFTATRWAVPLGNAVGFPLVLPQGDGSVIAATRAAGRHALRIGAFRVAPLPDTRMKLVALRLSSTGAPLWMTSVAAPERTTDMFGAWMIDASQALVVATSGTYQGGPPVGPVSMRLNIDDGHWEPDADLPYGSLLHNVGATATLRHRAEDGSIALHEVSMSSASSAMHTADVAPSARYEADVLADLSDENTWRLVILSPDFVGDRVEQALPILVTQPRSTGAFIRIGIADALGESVGSRGCNPGRPGIPPTTRERVLRTCHLSTGVPARPDVEAIVLLSATETTGRVALDEGSRGLTAEQRACMEHELAWLRVCPAERRTETSWGDVYSQ